MSDRVMRPGLKVIAMRDACHQGEEQSGMITTSNRKGQPFPQSRRVPQETTSGTEQECSDRSYSVL